MAGKERSLEGDVDEKGVQCHVLRPNGSYMCDAESGAKELRKRSLPKLYFLNKEIINVQSRNAEN
jgi:hypothetical protein